MSIVGIPIGFYGYVFPGNINLMVVELYRSKKYKFLLFVLALILIFETVYCLVSILVLKSIKPSVSFYTAIELTSYILVLLMGLWMFFENKRDNARSKRNTVYRGLLSIVFHPQQIPFWVVMGVVIDKFIHFTTNNYALYEFAFYNAVGTLLAMLFYMILGSKLFTFLKLNIAQINKIMGGVYVCLAIFGLLKMK